MVCSDLVLFVVDLHWFRFLPHVGGYLKVFCQASMKMARMLKEKRNWARMMREKRSSGSSLHLQDKLLMRLEEMDNTEHSSFFSPFSLNAQFMVGKTGQLTKVQCLDGKQRQLLSMMHGNYLGSHKLIHPSSYVPNAVQNTSTQCVWVRTHPYHALGPLNGPLRHSWGPQKGSVRAPMALLGAPEVLGEPRGA